MSGEAAELLAAAQAHLSARRLSAAEELYSRFIDRGPAAAGAGRDLATALNNRGQIKYFRVEFAAAMEDYTAAIQCQPAFEDERDIRIQSFLYSFAPGDSFALREKVGTEHTYFL
ncbi:PREDICTED: tetratricopeptide repeat protein 32 isoform X2 [Calidris pugnax]|uniref:tetratricopeptide repeat protein 32 isoform X2 n=1 Tax=Calidris pugnax TaxID=198806 RepID=UPI00071C2A6D|nr:PREDICTED: tetratricopeptide repeat protein 32 isoform X2 [Calidris pugnax]